MDDSRGARIRPPTSDQPPWAAFYTRGKGMPVTPYNPAAPGLALTFRPPVLACSDLISACSAPVPDLLSRVFRACSGSQAVGCKSGNAMTLHQFLERSGDRGARKAPASR